MAADDTPRKTWWRKVLHANINPVIPAGIFLSLLLTCAGLLPPVEVYILLVAGSSAAWSLHTTQRDRAAVFLCVATLLACFALLWPRVDIRAASPTDRTCDFYFGAWEEDFIARNIAVADGVMTLGTWLTGELFYVSNGQVERLNSFAVGRSPNQIFAPHWADMHITLALVRFDTAAGPVTQLGSAGQSRGGGGGSAIPTTVNPLHSHFSSGRLFSGQSRILYIEGDSELEVARGMTVEDFARVNKGNYYVVVAGMQ